MQQVPSVIISHIVVIIAKYDQIRHVDLIMKLLILCILFCIKQMTSHHLQVTFHLVSFVNYEQYYYNLWLALFNTSSDVDNDIT